MKLAKIPPRVGMLETRRLPVPPTQAQASRMRGRKLQTRNLRIKTRDKWTCQHCGWITTDLEVDHITPVAQGGTDQDENLQSLCIPCHQAKSVSDNAETARRAHS